MNTVQPAMPFLPRLEGPRYGISSKNQPFMKLQQQKNFSYLPVKTPPLTPPTIKYHVRSSCLESDKDCLPTMLPPQLVATSSWPHKQDGDQTPLTRRGSTKLLQKNSNGAVVNLLNDNEDHSSSNPSSAININQDDNGSMWMSSTPSSYSSTSSSSSSSLYSDDEFSTGYFDRKLSISSCWSEDGDEATNNQSRKLNSPNFVNHVQELQDQLLPLHLHQQHPLSDQLLPVQPLHHNQPSYQSRTLRHSRSTTNQVSQSSPSSTGSVNTATTSQSTPTNKRKYVCAYGGCNKSFTTSGHLARHNRIHTGEKNFPCLMRGCPSKFSRQDNMMQHYRTHTSSKSRRGSKTGPISKNTVPTYSLDASIDVKNLAATTNALDVHRTQNLPHHPSPYQQVSPQPSPFVQQHDNYLVHNHHPSQDTISPAPSSVYENYAPHHNLNYHNINNSNPNNNGYMRSTSPTLLPSISAFRPM